MLHHCVVIVGGGERKGYMGGNRRELVRGKDGMEEGGRG